MLLKSHPRSHKVLRAVHLLCSQKPDSSADWAQEVPGCTRLQRGKHQTYAARPVLQRALCLADTIITPEGPLALRLVGQLLLGVVRIHSLKINHLLGDCTQAVQRLDKVCSS